MDTNSCNDIKAADEKFRRGDRLTDAEVWALRKVYNDARQALWAIYHPSYSLVELDLYEKANKLNDMATARNFV